MSAGNADSFASRTARSARVSPGGAVDTAMTWSHSRSCPARNPFPILHASTWERWMAWLVCASWMRTAPVITVRPMSRTTDSARPHDISRVRLPYLTASVSFSRMALISSRSSFAIDRASAASPAPSPPVSGPVTFLAFPDSACVPSPQPSRRGVAPGPRPGPPSHRRPHPCGPGHPPRPSILVRASVMTRSASVIVASAGRTRFACASRSRSGCSAALSLCAVSSDRIGCACVHSTAASDVPIRPLLDRRLVSHVSRPPMVSPAEVVMTAIDAESTARPHGFPAWLGDFPEDGLPVADGRRACGVRPAGFDEDGDSGRGVDRRGARVGVGDADGVRGCGARVDGVRCLAERVVQAGENGAGRPGAGDHEFGVAGVPEPGADGERRGGDAVDRVDDYDALDDEREREQLLGGSPYASAREEHLVSGPDDRLIRWDAVAGGQRSEEHTSELQSHSDLVCRLLLEKKKKQRDRMSMPLTVNLKASAANS